MDDEPMWAADLVVAPTPSSAITIPETVNEFAIKGNYLTLVKGNQFDRRTKTDPHKHIHEFLRICDMFKYRDTKNEAVRLMMFPLSLNREAKTWLNELNEGTIETWDELQTAFISRLFPPALFDRLLGEIRAFSQHENESLTDAWLRMKEMLRNCHGHNLSKGNIIKIFYHGLSEITQEVLNAAAGTCRGIKRKNTRRIEAYEEITEDKDLPTRVHCFGHNSRFPDFALNIIKYSWEILVKSPYFALGIEVVEIESFKSSAQHSVNDFVVINIPEEDVEPKQIILDPDDQPVWESAKTVAPTPNSAIVQIDVDDNFVINSTHLKMICKNKFNGYMRANPHDHIRKFLAICDMFKYGETQSEAVKLLIFPFSLCDKAKTWFNELNEESITSNFSQLVCESLTDAWLRLKSMLRKYHGHGLTKGAIIQIFYHGLDEPTQGILDVTAGGIFLYKSPNQAFQLLEDKVLFNLDWSTKSQTEHHGKYVAFSGGSNSNNDNSRLMEKPKAMDSQIISLKEELQDMRNKTFEAIERQ
ncbi:reverse transcriptase domain-containing protein [Tanacetum coccineum]|uniref:Reverse transcriptase domain-containing protein n=1 Tax=Tanacetum coccineum TaxID=301880 RepID=A0ABQ5IK48_9ASTR